MVVGNQRYFTAGAVNVFTVSMYLSSVLWVDVFIFVYDFFLKDQPQSANK